MAGLKHWSREEVLRSDSHRFDEANLDSMSSLLEEVPLFLHGYSSAPTPSIDSGSPSSLFMRHPDSEPSPSLEPLALRHQQNSTFPRHTSRTAQAWERASSGSLTSHLLHLETLASNESSLFTGNIHHPSLDQHSTDHFTVHPCDDRAWFDMADLKVEDPGTPGHKLVEQDALMVSHEVKTSRISLLHLTGLPKMSNKDLTESFLRFFVRFRRGSLDTIIDVHHGVAHATGKNPGSTRVPRCFIHLKDFPAERQGWSYIRRDRFGRGLTIKPLRFTHDGNAAEMRNAKMTLVVQLFDSDRRPRYDSRGNVLRFESEPFPFERLRPAAVPPTIQEDRPVKTRAKKRGHKRARSSTSSSDTSSEYIATAESAFSDSSSPVSPIIWTPNTGFYSAVPECDAEKLAAACITDATCALSSSAQPLTSLPSIVEDRWRALSRELGFSHARPVLHSLRPQPLLAALVDPALAKADEVQAMSNAMAPRLSAKQQELDLSLTAGIIKARLASLHQNSAAYTGAQVLTVAELRSERVLVDRFAVDKVHCFGTWDAPGPGCIFWTPEVCARDYQLRQQLKLRDPLHVLAELVCMWEKASPSVASLDAENYYQRTHTLFIHSYWQALTNGSSNMGWRHPFGAVFDDKRFWLSLHTIHLDHALSALLQGNFGEVKRLEAQIRLDESLLRSRGWSTQDWLSFHFDHRV